LWAIGWWSDRWAPSKQSGWSTSGRPAGRPSVPWRRSSTSDNRIKLIWKSENIWKNAFFVVAKFSPQKSLIKLGWNCIFLVIIIIFLNLHETKFGFVLSSEFCWTWLESPLNIFARICERKDAVWSQVEAVRQVDGVEVRIPGKDRNHELVRDLLAARQDQLTQIGWAVRQNLRVTKQRK